MKKIKRFLITALCFVISMTGLTACGDATKAETQKQAVAYVIANTANSQGLNFNSPMARDTIYNTILNYGYISVVEADGKPEAVSAASYDIDDQYKNASKEKLKIDAQSKTNSLLTEAQSITANDPEVDYLESLRLAVRSLSSLEDYTSKTIIVMGTALQTTGILNFRNNLLSADPAYIADALAKKEEIPDFTGITVIFQQLGDVAAPQPSLSTAQRNKLCQIWEAIIEKGGGSFVCNDIMANPVNENQEYPSVSVVELPEDTPLTFSPEALTEESTFEEPRFLSEEQVAFIPDSADYLDPQAAETTITPIADYMNEHDITLLLAGTTAGDEDNDYTLSLSRQRAETVRDTLIKLGVNENNILTAGLGSSDPWHIQGAGYDGDMASQNRKVVLIDAASDTAKELLNN